MQRYSRSLAALLALALLVGLAAQSVEAATDSPADGAGYTPTAADLSAFALLTTAADALERINELPPGVDRASAFGSAIYGLTGLYQLHGCEWALPKLREVFELPQAPDMRLGWSADGRLQLRIDPLELQNPVFERYTVLLLTLESNTAQPLDLSGAQLLRITRRDGSLLTAEPLTPEHLLWPHLRNLAPTFEVLGPLPGGASLSYKQLFAVPPLDAAEVAHVELSWDNGALRVPYYESRN